MTSNVTPGRFAKRSVPTFLEFTESIKEIVMLYWTVVFFVVALVAAFLGFTGIAGAAAGIAKILFIAFLVLAVGSLLLGRRVVS